MDKPLTEDNVVEALKAIDVGEAVAFLSLSVHIKDGRLVPTAIVFTREEGGLPDGHRLMRMLVEGAGSIVRPKVQRAH